MRSISLALKDAFHSWGDNPHGGPHRLFTAVLERSPSAGTSTLLSAGSSGRRGLRQDNRRGQIRAEQGNSNLRQPEEIRAVPRQRGTQAV
jgi:hypothetical protein